MMANAFYRVRHIVQALFEALLIVFILFSSLSDITTPSGDCIGEFTVKATTVNQQIGWGVQQLRGTTTTSSILKSLALHREIIAPSLPSMDLSTKKNLFMSVFERSAVYVFSSASAP